MKLGEHRRFTALCELYLRPLTGWTTAADGSIAPFFEPPLSAAEQATLADIVLMDRFGVDLTLAEWQSIKADVAGLKTYNGLASPTLAQTVAATKAQNRVLAVIIRSD